MSILIDSSSDWPSDEALSRSGVERPRLSSSSLMPSDREIGVNELDLDELDLDELDLDELDPAELDADEIDADEIDADELVAAELDAAELDADELDAKGLGVEEPTVFLICALLYLTFFNFSNSFAIKEFPVSFN